MAKNAKINEPTLEQQRELNRVVINSVDKVKVRDVLLDSVALVLLCEGIWRA